jgi:hypothetical protein
MQGVRVNAMAPRTWTLEGEISAERRAVAARTPAGRLAEPEESPSSEARNATVPGPPRAKGRRWTRRPATSASAASCGLRARTSGALPLSRRLPPAPRPHRAQATLMQRGRAVVAERRSFGAPQRTASMCVGGRLVCRHGGRSVSCQEPESEVTSIQMHGRRAFADERRGSRASGRKSDDQPRR